ncbi:hypothetical protein A3H53_04795 [Candidatus Nomurabacteria bacterium RIFCSPLOWO2_02_FULL_40_10]|uniref:Uncharacterized protein n=2 Tax=Candidatus Nomuraibacteriota TaxID=1752729 RepID=A0A1F6XY77_9BACT|nr:MAG: hypothetical protein A2642_00765 [Candidatus Nomurabacteria bacterium RIFCSPHIGHO2_01_FULL_39_10]OGI99041.1 MAG: hypothetical protein A3H53_04795 [Candidatus Nomurabacteria bacterium RIFCSPLOWO2_02_FULL_40_10]
MSKKIWLLVSSILFILPEILWSPLGNFIYSLFVPTVNGSSQIWRNNFLLDSKFYSLYITILLIQLIGIVVFVVNWVRFKNYLKSKLAYFVVLILSIFLSFTTLLVLFIAYAVHNISF